MVEIRNKYLGMHENDLELYLDAIRLVRDLEILSKSVARKHIMLIQESQKEIWSGRRTALDDLALSRGWK